MRRKLELLLHKTGVLDRPAGTSEEREAAAAVDGPSLPELDGQAAVQRVQRKKLGRLFRKG